MTKAQELGITEFPYREYKDGNLIYKEREDGTWSKYVYDERGYCIWSYYSNGGWELHRFYDTINVTCRVISSGRWWIVKKKLNENCEISYYNNSKGTGKAVEERHPNNKVKEIIRYQNKVLEHHKKWDMLGRPILVKTKSRHLEAEYNDKNWIVYYRRDNDWFKRTFDNRGNIIFYEDSWGNWFDKGIFPNSRCPYEGTIRMNGEFYPYTQYP